MKDEDVPTSAGLSSFNLLDEKTFFAELDLKQGMVMFDLACGVGNYAVASSPYIGETGSIVAMDLWHEGIETLAVRNGINRLSNIIPIVADACSGLPVKKGSFGCCLMATIAHILSQEKKLQKVLSEVRDILCPEGILAVVEFRKIEGPPGPPLAWRLSPEELELVVSSCGYHLIKNSEIGPYNYLSLFINRDK